MEREELQSGACLKKSPFLVVKRASDGVRVYSKLHGNLTSFDFDVSRVLSVFDPENRVESAAKKIPGMCARDPVGLIRELYEKRFLVEKDTSAEDLFSEHVRIVSSKNRIPKVSKVTFLVSASCNLTCRGCYHHFYDFKSADMDPDIADRILTGLFPYLKKRGVEELLISFLGYEPL
ncbi:MAG TPA: hypothetical protein VMT62_05240, partial [Syntrophorhabdaceae bacterium]|nr:hypothetical protein [Syntrophorhabdaceae bacterium]